MNTVLHPNQSAVAKELGIDVAEMASAEDAINAIEMKLGEASAQVRARWFAVSVLRHLKKAKWHELNDSTVDEKQQRKLAKACLAVKGFATSLGTVTKDSRSKFRFVGFASSKNIERGMLATGTKAYKIAAAVVAEAGLIEEHAEASSNLLQPQAETKPKPKPKSKSKSKRTQSKAVEKSVVGRRAKRRAYAQGDTEQATDTADALANKNESAAMSREEFASLDAALSKSDTEIVQQNWVDQPNEDRLSRILGILAGVGFFIFIALLFL